MFKFYSIIIVVVGLHLSAFSNLYSQEKQFETTTLSDSLRNNGSSITIKTPEFNKGLVLQPSHLVIGNIAGLTVSQPGSNPERFIDIRIRGLSSIRATTSPLYVIDGVPVRDIEHLEPDDIRSVEVLKDASTSARYGIRGAAGIFKIRTKTGHKQEKTAPTVSYETAVASSFLANRIEFLDPKQYRLFAETGSPVPAPDYESATNWQDKVIQNGLSNVHNLSISGGNQQSQYRISGNYRTVGTIHPGADEKKIGARIFLSHRALEDHLLLTGRLAVSNKNSNIGLPEVFRYANTFNPTAPVFDESNDYFEVNLFDSFNPLSILNQAVHDRESDFNSISAEVRYDAERLVPGLLLQTRYSRENYNIVDGEYYGKSLQFRGSRNKGLARLDTKKFTDQFFETTVIYKRRFNPFSNNIELGYNYHSMQEQGQFTSGGNFLSDKVLYHNLESARDFSNGLGTVESFLNDHTIIGFFADLKTSYKNQIFASAVVRHEGSTRLGENNKWGTFYGINIGAELTHWIDTDLFNSLYPRIGYGMTGQLPPVDGLSQRVFNDGPKTVVNGNFVPSLILDYAPNPDLKWEKKKEINIGFDVDILNNRFRLSFDYFSNRIDDILYPAPVSVPPNLAATKWTNIGTIENNGMELTVRYHHISSERLKWNSALLFSKVRSTLVSLSNDQFQIGNTVIAYPGAPGFGGTQLIHLNEGDKIGNFWGPEFAGFDNEGKWMFKDGSGEVVPRDDIRMEDYKVIGNGLPDFSLGWNHQLAFKNWDLSMLWKGEFGHDMVNLYRLYYENPRSVTNYNITKSARNSNLNDASIYNSYYVENASYFRLQHLMIGYTFEFAPESRIRRLRMFAAGNNLWTITNYSGIDPTARLSSLPPTDNGTRQIGNRSPLAPGIERRNLWPTQTTLLAGFKIDF